MHRTLRRAPLRYILETLSSWKSNKHGRSSIVNLTFCSCFRSFTTLTGNELLGCLEKSTMRTAQMQIVDALHLGDRHRASYLLSDFVNQNSSSKADDFVDVLYYCAISPDPLFVMEIWRVMHEKEISLNSSTVLLMLRSLCRGGYLDEALHLIEVCGDKDHLSPILRIYNYFLRACAKQRSMIHVDKCLELMDSRMVGKNNMTYLALLNLAGSQRNLSAVQEIWKEYIIHYSPSIFSLREYIRSFARAGDLMSAYRVLQQMVAIALRGKLNFKVKSEERLPSSRMDVSLPLNAEVELQEVEIKENEHPIAVTVDHVSHDMRKTTIDNTQNRGFKSHGVGWIRKLKGIHKCLLRSFNNLMNACARTRNSELADQLIQQMQKLGFRPSELTYNGYVIAIIKKKGYGSGMEVLKMMRKQQLKPWDLTLIMLSKSCSIELQLDLAEILLDQVSSCCFPYPFNHLLAACDSMDRPERAVRVLAKMKELNILPDIRTYELLFSLFGAVNAPYENGNMLSQADTMKRIQLIEKDMAKNGVTHSQVSIMKLLKALGEEGLVKEMIKYSSLAENLFGNTSLGTPIYNTVMHSLVTAGESKMAIKIYQSLRSCGIPLDAATYAIMIDCCSVVCSFKSAYAVVSLMIRDGFPVLAITYTSLIKVMLRSEKFGEALNLLDQARLDGVELDVLPYNTILEKAYKKGRIDVIEYLIERMRRDKISPDPTTCYFVFDAYFRRRIHATALEALNVMSLRMLGEEDSDVFEKWKTEFEENFVFAEDPEAESRILRFFEDSEVNLSAALLNLRWLAIQGFSISWSEKQSSWAKRLSASYDNIESD